MFLNLQHKIAVFSRHVPVVVCSLLFFLFCTVDSVAQKVQPPEEIGLVVTVPRVGSTEIGALIQGDTAYLSITNLFDYLKIRNKISPDLDSVTGFILTPSAAFTISKQRNKIFYQDRYFTLQPMSLLRTGSDLYLRSDYFGKVFGLDCAFDFRSLAVMVKTKIELPVIREMQQEFIRKNISQLKGERKADTTIGRQFPLFKMGTADWSVSSSQHAGGVNENRINLLAGAMLLGGEASLNLNVAPGELLDQRMQYYRWRFVNNDNSWLRQVNAGTVYTESVSTLLAPMQGIQFSNAPTTYRKSFGTYIISNTTQPGWVVELYVNNILINYTKADASGFYTFEVPMVYGNSSVKLRFYGPWGEEQTKEESIVIPFNFLPANQFEYTLTGGLVKEDKSEKFSRLNLKYGLSKAITIGAGMEYFSAVTSGAYMPYASAALRLFSHVILYGEHTYGVRTKGVLNYRHPSNLQIDINYTKYEPGQTAVKLLEERKAVFSMPFRGKNYTAFSRLSITQVNDLKTKTTSAELLVSSFFSGVSSNFTTLALLTQPRNPFIRSTLALTFRLPQQMRFTQQVQYEYINRNFSELRSEVEKSVFKSAYINLAYERNMVAKVNNLSLGLRINLSGLQAAFYTLRSNHSVATFETAKGSLLYDDNSDRLRFTSQGNVGRGGITVRPFLDLNCNGKRDPGEQAVCGLKLRVNGGLITHCTADTTIQITNLESYANYLLELDKNSFDNVAWQIKKPLINVVADPNYFKRVDVPVAVVGEVEGKVFMQTEEGLKPQGRILVRFFKDGKQVARAMTESDGYFNYMGFAPGQYTAEIDSEQVKNLKLDVAPGVISFTIKANKEGELLRDLKFELKKKEE